MGCRRAQDVSVQREHEAGLDAAHAHLWPKLGAARWAMNQSDGYGVFSLTPTPLSFIKRGTQQVTPEGHALLASDGLMRLVDVFRLYTAEELLGAAVTSESRLLGSK